MKDEKVLCGPELEGGRVSWGKRPRRSKRTLFFMTRAMKETTLVRGCLHERIEVVQKRTCMKDSRRD